MSDAAEEVKGASPIVNNYCRGNTTPASGLHYLAFGDHGPR